MEQMALMPIPAFMERFQVIYGIGKMRGDKRVLNRGESFGNKGFWALVFVHHDKIYGIHCHGHIAIAVNNNRSFRQKEMVPASAGEAD